jgi:hypothetical protein
MLAFFSPLPLSFSAADIDTIADFLRQIFIDAATLPHFRRHDFRYAGASCRFADAFSPFSFRHSLLSIFAFRHYFSRLIFLFSRH